MGVWSFGGFFLFFFEVCFFFLLWGFVFLVGFFIGFGGLCDLIFWGVLVGGFFGCSGFWFFGVFLLFGWVLVPNTCFLEGILATSKTFGF